MKESKLASIGWAFDRLIKYRTWVFRPNQESQVQQTGVCVCVCVCAINVFCQVPHCKDLPYVKHFTRSVPRQDRRAEAVCSCQVGHCWTGSASIRAVVPEQGLSDFLHEPLHIVSLRR